MPQEYSDNLPLDRWIPILQISRHIGFAIKDQSESVATCSIGAGKDEEMHGLGEMFSLYCLPQYFYKGYSKALLAHAVPELKKMGYHKIYIWVLEENYQVRAFYKRNGFTPNGNTEMVQIGGRDLVELRYVYQGE